MMFGETVSGQQCGWSLLKKLGEGDAGEVYLAESLLEKRAAILKRPHRSSFSSEIIRQASQIETEAKVLRALNGARSSSAAASIRVPALLDHSPAGTEFSDRFFIVIEKASGLDLKSLARAARFGPGDPGEANPDLLEAERYFLQGLARIGCVPYLILLRALAGVIDLLETIHTHHSVVDGAEQSGVIWNDVKPEHLFWDPSKLGFMVIDWGNSQFLEADGATKDRRYSRLEDYSQFLQEMGKFLADTAPQLHESLAWPDASLQINEYPDLTRDLKERVSELIYEELEGLRDARQREAGLLASANPGLELLGQLDEVQDQLIAYGEYPDFSGSEKLYARLAAKLASEARLDEFRQVCRRAGQIPGASGEKWELLEQVSGIAAQTSPAARPAFLRALVSGVSEDWAAALWDLLSILKNEPDTSAWDEISARIRRMQVGSGAEGLTPFVTVSRMVFTLQDILPHLSDLEPERVKSYENVLRVLKEEVVKKWNQLEPDPPDSGLEYQDIDRLIEPIGEMSPEAQVSLVRALDQPKAQVKIILDAWGRKDFETARRGLRNLLLWDPDRRRVFAAERAIQATPAWLERVYLGPKKGEPLPDFMLEMELSGRELRNQVGPAGWLDLILETFASLRKGASPADLIAARPEVLGDVFWLNDYESRRPAPPPRARPLRLEREGEFQSSEPSITGIQEGTLGQDGELLLTDSLDTWAPEARGSSARVFLGFLRASGGRLRQSAIKFMRPERGEYALPLFREEVQILTLMRDVPGVTGLLECGYIQFDGGVPLPSDEKQASARDLSGRVLRYGTGEMRDFLASLESRVEQGWLPYLAMEKHNREDNLMVLSDAGYTHGRFLPVADALVMSIQICDILHLAHARNIVYRDHKILHYYWLEHYNGIYIIDWNVAKRYPQGLSEAEKQLDLVQFGARALHHILTGRPAPGALPLGPTRPDEIEHASRTYRTQWNYDDQRLPAVVKDTIQRVLAGEYTSFKKLRDDLYQSFLQVQGNGYG